MECKPPSIQKTTKQRLHRCYSSGQCTATPTQQASTAQTQATPVKMDHSRINELINESQLYIQKKDSRLAQKCLKEASDLVQLI